MNVLKYRTWTANIKKNDFGKQPHFDQTQNDLKTQLP
jgi:hypothetical protein